MLWIAVHLPCLSLESFAATLEAGQQARPIALLQQHRVQTPNAAARGLGIEAGMKRATALALAPGLLFAPADAARDAAALQAVAHAALAFTPAVCLDRLPGAEAETVLLEVQASLRLFGGPARLLTKLRQALAPLQHRLQIATAPTAAGAALLARWRGDPDGAVQGRSLDALRRQLDGAPLAWLGAAREHLEALRGMGLHTLGDVGAQPRAGLARRFGEPLLDEIDRARGARPDPREPIRPPPTFDGRLELQTRADHADQLLHGAERLLVRLVAWAQAQQAGVVRFMLSMQHEPRHRSDDRTPPCTEIEVAPAEPSHEVAHLQLLLRERLLRQPLPAPTLELRLHCHEVRQRPPPNGELFPTRAGEAEGLSRLVERLQARLGPERVRRLVLVQDHRPERSSLLQPVEPARLGVGGGPTLAAAAAAVRDGPLARPVWLLPEPQALAERGSQPLLDGRPLQLLAGPERIEAGWWDGDLAARDYFVAATHDGALVWVYRARLPLAGDAAEGWFLHGRFG